jgi:mannose/fructose/N-acetylgalactosamine-specific phosphotransferase system component IID
MSRRVGPLVLGRVAWGSFFLQAAFNTERRQGVGFAAAMAPLARLFPDPEARARFLRRHGDSFNTNPGLAGVVLGAAARLEERGADGDAGALDRLRRLKQGLEAPLSAAGDRLLWGGMRPASALWGSAAVTAFGAGGSLLFLALYNAVHLGFRIGGVYWGYHAAERAASILRSPLLALLLAAIPWFLAGGGAVFGALALGGEGGAGLLGLATAAVGLFLGRRRIARGTALAAGGIILGLIAAFLSRTPVP